MGEVWSHSRKKDMNIIIDNALNSSKISIKEAAEAKSIIDKYDEFVPMQNLANLSFGKNTNRDFMARIFRFVKHRAI